MTEELLTTSDAQRWNAILPARRGVFGSVEFARIQERQRALHARLFVRRLGAGLVAYPFFLRAIEGDPFPTGGAPWWDIVTPEYTGPIAIEAEDDPALAGFADAFGTWCERSGVVAEFAHLHPWRTRDGMLDPMNVRIDREIVHVDLALSEDQLWNESLNRTCRKNVNRARRETVRVFAATTPAEIAEFHRIYTLTMERNGALERYRFPLGYFLAIYEQMRANARFVLAGHAGRIVAGTLFLHDDTDVFAFLGGADPAHQHVRPSNAVHFETILWAKECGKQRLVLGGGYRADDGIFQFKSTFSPLRARFCTYRRIHLPEVYGALCERWRAFHGPEANDDDYFPLYRARADRGARQFETSVAGVTE